LNLWIATKGFISHSRPPFLDLSWRKKDLPSSRVQLRSAVWTGDTRDTRPKADVREPRMSNQVAQADLNHLRTQTLQFP
jgi:hypothetical protein